MNPKFAAVADSLKPKFDELLANNALPRPQASRCQSTTPVSRRWWLEALQLRTLPADHQQRFGKRGGRQVVPSHQVNMKSPAVSWPAATPLSVTVKKPL